MIKKLLEEAAEEITTLMCNWHPCENAADYCCEFCGRTSKSNEDTEINHNKDCFGVNFLRKFHALKE